MNNLEENSEQNVILKNRKAMELSGIIDVESFTDTSIIAESSLGSISIDGEGLKIESFSSTDGKLTLCGKVDAFCYFGREKKKRSLFRRHTDGE